MTAPVRILVGLGLCLGPALLASSALEAQPVSSTRDATLTVVVVDPDRASVPGALVRLTTTAGPVRDGVTGDDGAARFEALAPAPYAIHVLAEGFRAEPARVALEPGATARAVVTLRLSGLTDSVVVSASQVETPLATLGASATVLTVADLAASQAETVVDGLRFVPGMTISATGGRGTVTSVFPRGGESDYTLVLVDGLRQNAFGGAFDFGHLALADVERIEVVRGPQSALFGSDAIGAVVHVVTRRPAGLRASGLVEGGSFGTLRATAAASGSLRGFGWSGAVDRVQSDGYTGPAPANGETVSNDDYARTDLSAAATYRSSRHDLRLSARRAQDERGYPGPFGRDPNGTFPGVDRISRGENTRSTLAAGWATRGAWRARLRADAGWADFDGRFASAFGDSFSETRRLNGRVQGDVAATASLGLSAGVEALDERARSSFIAGDGRDVLPIERSVVGTFAEARYERGPAYVVAGLRVERLHRAALAGDADPFVGRPAFGPDTVVSANPKIAAAWFLARPEAGRAGWTRVRASAGTGIRPPDAFEIAFTDNPALRPERSRSVDVGLEQAWLGGALVAEATWFSNHYTDLIVPVGQSFRDASRFRTDNIANARARGLEAGLHLRTRAGLRVAGVYTWLDTAVLDVDGAPGEAPAPFSPGDWLIRRPRHTGGLDVVMTRARWQGFARVFARGGVLDVDPSFGAFGGTLRAPGFLTVDAGVAVRAAKGVEVFGRVTNLFDRPHEVALGFPALGRSAMAGIRLARSR